MSKVVDRFEISVDLLLLKDLCSLKTLTVNKGLDASPNAIPAEMFIKIKCLQLKSTLFGLLTYLLFRVSSRFFLVYTISILVSTTMHTEFIFFFGGNH